MALVVPKSLAEALAVRAATDSPIDEIQLGDELRRAVGEPSGLTAEERKGAWAEIEAFNFLTHEGGDRAPWESYFKPMARLNRDDGVEVYFPDAAEIDAEIISHWQTRAGTITHPTLKARYADLVWEFAKRTSAGRPEIRFARMAIDSYLDAIERGITESERQVWRFVDRALGLALSASDDPRAARAKSVLFTFYRHQLKLGGRFMWWKLDEIAWDQKALALSPAERQEIFDGLEATLAYYADPDPPEQFDPWAALAAADRLVLHRQQLNQPDEARRAMKTAGSVFETVAAKAGALVAGAWLEQVLRRYQDLGLNDDAARVEGVIKARSDEAGAAMRRLEVTLPIAPEEIDRLLDELTAGTADETLARIALNFLTKEDATRDMVVENATHAPLVARIPINIAGPYGFTGATIGSVENDLPGRVLHQAADLLTFNAPLLAAALDRAKDRHGLEAGDFLGFIVRSPIVDGSQHPLLQEGIEAWLEGDNVKAIHVLVPQVEAALRTMLRAMGIPVMRPDRHSGGFEVIGMGRILHAWKTQERVNQDAQLHFRVLYCDPRGLNLRNRLAHGVAQGDWLQRSIAGWVIHSLLWIGLLRIKPGV